MRVLSRDTTCWRIQQAELAAGVGFTALAVHGHRHSGDTVRAQNLLVTHHDSSHRMHETRSSKVVSVVLGGDREGLLSQVKNSGCLPIKRNCSEGTVYFINYSWNIAFLVLFVNILLRKLDDFFVFFLSGRYCVQLKSEAGLNLDVWSQQKRRYLISIISNWYCCFETSFTLNFFFSFAYVVSFN